MKIKELTFTINMLHVDSRMICVGVSEKEITVSQDGQECPK